MPENYLPLNQLMLIDAPNMCFTTIRYGSRNISLELPQLLPHLGQISGLVVFEH
jgi:hypothetical protein